MEEHPWEEPNLQRAKDAFASADVLLVGAGAGMGVDSGLKVYADVNASPFFAATGLSYAHLADPDMQVKDPQRYMAFAASNVTEYRRHEPHQGYALLRKWQRIHFMTSAWSTLLTAACRKHAVRPLPSEGLLLPGAFFVFTTNVDGYFQRAGFEDHVLCHTHGLADEFQCSGMAEKGSWKRFTGPCSKHVYRVPRDFSFDYDVEHMCAPVGAPKQVSASGDPWTANHPMCPECGAPLRPRVYQFGDQCFVANETEEATFFNWQQGLVRQSMQALEQGTQAPRVVMLELGVGLRLPKIRVTFERLLEQLPSAHLVRVNPQYANTPVTACSAEAAQRVIPIAAGALETLQALDTVMEQRKT